MKVTPSDPPVLEAPGAIGLPRPLTSRPSKSGLVWAAIVRVEPLVHGLKSDSVVNRVCAKDGDPEVRTAIAAVKASRICFMAIVSF